MSINIQSAADLNSAIEDLKRENELTAGQLQALVFSGLFLWLVVAGAIVFGVVILL